MNDTQLDGLLIRCHRLLDRVESWLPPAEPVPDWDAAIAWRWRLVNRGGVLQPVHHPHRLAIADLRCIERQKEVCIRNTRQFVNRLPANNVLLRGARGTGKSSLVKALLNHFATEGLRLIEIDKYDLVQLPNLISVLEGRPERFIIFCDDLSFEAHEPNYKALKAVLDGSVSVAPENVLIYATSNRRHLLPEYRHENLDTRLENGELHHGEAVEEKISLSERFGLWVSFYPFGREQYLEIVRYWLERLPEEPLPEGETKVMEEAAWRWAAERGSRSGRTAWQFARDWAGRRQLEGRGGCSVPGGVRVNSG